MLRPLNGVYILMAIVDTELTSVCAVCLEDCTHNGIIVACGHKFHENCLLRWVLEQKDQVRELQKFMGDTAALRGKCPVCRQKLAHIFNVKKSPEVCQGSCVIS